MRALLGLVHRLPGVSIGSGHRVPCHMRSSCDRPSRAMRTGPSGRAPCCPSSTWAGAPSRSAGPDRTSMRHTVPSRRTVAEKPAKWREYTAPPKATHPAASSRAGPRCRPAASSRPTRVPGPAASPHMGRHRIDVGRDHIGLDLVAPRLLRGAGVIDRVEQREQRVRPVAGPSLAKARTPTWRRGYIARHSRAGPAGSP